MKMVESSEEEDDYPSIESVTPQSEIDTVYQSKTEKRKKVKLAYISNDAERRASFKKRKKRLIKKVRELSILCGIQACAIIYSPYDPEPEVWPSRAGVLEVLVRYRSLSDVDKTVKTVNQESFTRQRIKKSDDQLVRLRKENKRLEMEIFMFRCIACMTTLRSFDIRDSAEMGWVVNQMLKDIMSRMEDLKSKGLHAGSTPRGMAAPAVVPPAAVPPPAGGDAGYLLEHICGTGTSTGGTGPGPGNGT